MAEDKRDKGEGSNNRSLLFTNVLRLIINKSLQPTISARKFETVGSIRIRTDAGRYRSERFKFSERCIPAEHSTLEPTLTNGFPDQFGGAFYARFGKHVFPVAIYGFFGDVK